MPGIFEIVIVSGKGGTGKTTVAGGFTQLCQNGVFCDCDVDAANLGLILNPRIVEEHEFRSSKKPYLDETKCTDCGLCHSICRFDAIRQNPVSFDLSACESCGFCARVCPEGAIYMKEWLSGYWFVSETDRGPLVHARLEPGEENSGKLVAVVRQRAKELAGDGRNIIITDGPPGIGCPVISSLSGANMALAVTEPTLSGMHDLRRIIRVCKQFSVPVKVVINKWDIDEENTQAIRKLADDACCEVLGLVPYDIHVPKAMVKGVPVNFYDCPAGDSIRDIWRALRQN